MLHSASLDGSCNMYKMAMLDSLVNPVNGTRRGLPSPSLQYPASQAHRPGPAHAHCLTRANASTELRWLSSRGSEMEAAWLGLLPPHAENGVSVKPAMAP